MSAAFGAAILVVGLSACAHHSVTAGQDYGQVRTEASASQSTSSDQVVGTAPAPANTQGVEGSSTPAIISGPAKVDNSGRAYTSSAAGGTGNASATGLNTNVNIIPEKSTSNVTVTQSPAVTTETTQTTIAETTPVTTQTQTEVMAPVVETPAAPVTTTPITTTETQSTTTESAPMTSNTTTQESTTTTTTTTQATHTHRRMRKD